MAFLYINTGTSANSGDGDTLRSAFAKINYNFSQMASSNTSSVSISDINELPTVDIKAYRGTFTLPVDPDTAVKLFEFDNRIYRSASVDISAEDQTQLTQDSATGYAVSWNEDASHIVGIGLVSLHGDGTTSNAIWELKNTAIDGNQIQIQAYNVSGSTSNNIISWRAKVSLFRL